MILAKIDQSSMWYGVEARSPFLNKSFVQWILSFDESLFYKNFKGKII